MCVSVWGHDNPNVFQYEKNKKIDNVSLYVSGAKESEYKLKEQENYSDS